jgi:hypothetical protein
VFELEFNPRQRKFALLLGEDEEGAIKYVDSDLAAEVWDNKYNFYISPLYCSKG